MCQICQYCQSYKCFTLRSVKPRSSKCRRLHHKRKTLWIIFKIPYSIFMPYLPPANEVCEGYVFTRVCQSFCSWGGVRGCGAGGWACMVAGGHAWLRGACVVVGGGACVIAGGACVGYDEIQLMSGQYTLTGTVR